MAQNGAESRRDLSVREDSGRNGKPATGYLGMCHKMRTQFVAYVLIEVILNNGGHGNRGPL